MLWAPMSTKTPTRQCETIGELAILNTGSAVNGAVPGVLCMELVKLMLAIFATCLLWLLIAFVFVVVSVLVPVSIVYAGYIACMSTDIYVVRVFVIAVCGFTLGEVLRFIWSVLKKA